MKKGSKMNTKQSTTWLKNTANLPKHMVCSHCENTWGYAANMVHEGWCPERVA